MAHKFTGANIVFKHQRPQRTVYSDREALNAFVGWTAEAIETCPMNEDAKAIVDALIASQGSTHFDYNEFTVLRIDGFLDWVTLASEHGAPDEKASRMITILTDYREQLDLYQNQIRNYWYQ
jgi:hypothetical protein